MLRRHICLSLILSFTCNFFAYFKFHSDWGRVIGKIKRNELDCRDTAPLNTRAPEGGKVVLIDISSCFFLSLHHRFFWTLRIQTEGEIPRRYSYLFAILRRNWRAYWSQPVAGRREPRVYAGTTGHVLRVYPRRRKRWRSAYCMYTL